MRCTAKEAPNWPQARLQPDKITVNGVDFVLEWTPHSGIDAFTHNAKGLVPATELRALFQKLRRAPARLLPSYPSVPLPEMACFDPSKRYCLY